MHLLSCILATWFLFAFAGLAINNPEFAYSDPEAWTEVDSSTEDQAFLEEQTNQP